MLYPFNIISLVFSDLYFLAIDSTFLELRVVMFAEAALIAKQTNIINVKNVGILWTKTQLLAKRHNMKKKRKCYNNLPIK